ncbi:PaaI family thioesterase [Sphingobium sp. HWE2-09]|uniref:PaaI family thioesterase n=1 Tax=Sphingobium sp. HWE2-09 TaxID=3108390 RepID=UPI002DC6A81B|nr:PaaI family thioesterase [Sphingobium sp. HWE2-09]
MDRPYAAFLGIRIDEDHMGLPVCSMSPSEKNSGHSGMLHGGALAGLLECAAGVFAESVTNDASIDVQPVSITVDYMRAAMHAETHANAEIVRRGDRIIHVDATAWQEDAGKPIAMARLVFSLRR